MSPERYEEERELAAVLLQAKARHLVEVIKARSSMAKCPWVSMGAKPKTRS